MLRHWIASFGKRCTKTTITRVFARVTQCTKQIEQTKEYVLFAVVISSLSQADDDLNSNVTISRRQDIPCYCGRRNNKDGKIVNGSNAKPHEFPWRVGLYKRSWFLGRPSYDCSAALIDENWILTAAHCFEKVQTYLYLVSLGDNNLQSPQSKNFRRISKIVTHPEYNKLIEYDNDIALMKLERSVEYSESISPICLPLKRRNFVKSKATTSGWGILHEAYGTAASYLKSVELDVISNKKCSKLNYQYNITENMICTLTPGKDACKGDSGSSLDWLDPKSQKYSAIGVVSFGDGCAKDDKPGVYARVSRYIKWIKKTTGATFCKP